jgi:hypothetical protein
MSEPTPGEIMRRLDTNTTQLSELSRQFREDRDRADIRYVPRGEWVEGRRADQGLVKDVGKDVQELKDMNVANVAFRRQFTVALVATALSSFGALAVAIILLILSGGRT